MPFLEIYHFDLAPEARVRAAEAVTGSLAAAYGISPQIISAYFVNCTMADYAHAGVMPAPIDQRRMFVKVHGFARPVSVVADASARMTEALCAACAVEPENVAIYFLHRSADEVAHAGRLASKPDRGGGVPAALAHLATVSTAGR